MGYATRQNVYDILAQALTTATATTVNGQPVPLVNFGNTKSNNSISDDVVNQYISWASDQIDASLSELYVTPFMQKVDVELRLLNDVDPYNSFVNVSRAAVLTPGDVLIFSDTLNEEEHVVTEVSTSTQIELDYPLSGIYYAETTRVMRVRFPPTLNLICSRMAAANLYDKYFAAQANPNISDYGKNLRALALSDLNAVLNGIIILHGQKRIGHRFFNPTLRDRYGLPAIENDGSRDMKGGGQ